MRADRQLILEDGSTFPGMGFGSRKDAVYGIVFNTSCVGYQEILSDCCICYYVQAACYR